MLLAVFLGAMLGWPNTIVAFYAIVIPAAVVGILYAVKKKVFRGLQVPLVPFMLLGYIVATFFSTEIFRLLLF